MPSSSQYRSRVPPGACGGPTTEAGEPVGWPGARHAPPPVIVTNLLPWPVTVWMTTELCRKPLEREKPQDGLAGPR
jgi:hypothetical protein